MKTAIKLAIISTLMAIYGAAWAIPTPPPPIHPIRNSIPEPTIQKFTCNRVIQTMNAYKTYEVCNTNGIQVLFNASQKGEVSVLMQYGAQSETFSGVSNSVYYAPVNSYGVNYSQPLIKNGDTAAIIFAGSTINQVGTGNIREAIVYDGSVRVIRAIPATGSWLASSSILVNMSMTKATYFYKMNN